MMRIKEIIHLEWIWNYGRDLSD